eukprot:10936927-Lingulodinium_polyedra.AAC.1
MMYSSSSPPGPVLPEPRSIATLCTSLACAARRSTHCTAAAVSPAGAEGGTVAPAPGPGTESCKAFALAVAVEGATIDEALDPAAAPAGASNWT